MTQCRLITVQKLFADCRTSNLSCNLTAARQQFVALIIWQSCKNDCQEAYHVPSPSDQSCPGQSQEDTASAEVHIVSVLQSQLNKYLTNL